MSTPANNVPLLDRPSICEGRRERRSPVYFHSYQYSQNSSVPVAQVVYVAQGVPIQPAQPIQPASLALSIISPRSNLMDYYLLAPLPEGDFPYDNLADGSGYNIGWEPVNRS